MRKTDERRRKERRTSTSPRIETKRRKARPGRQNKQNLLLDLYLLHSTDGQAAQELRSILKRVRALPPPPPFLPPTRGSPTTYRRK